MNQIPLSTDSILNGLKDFQRDTVEYVFRRLYLDDDCTRRFLVADEVGLGKTLVARGVIAKVIDHLRDRADRIDVVYVCSNSDIARQNIQKLNVTGYKEQSLSSRITLLARLAKSNADDGKQHAEGSRKSSVNFISFTPGTSFDLKHRTGMSGERELLYWLLKEPWSLDRTKATRVLHASADIDDFRERVDQFHKWYLLHPQISRQFADSVISDAELHQEWNEVCKKMPRARSTVPPDLAARRKKLIGRLRQLLAETCLHWLKPDLIILDEFQRFKYLLQGDSDDASPAAQLAEHLFSFQQLAADPATAARVLLLSATPYKMYTQSREIGQDDHYQDFRATLDFLLQDRTRQAQLHERLTAYRDELFRLTENGCRELLRVKHELEQALRKVMVRTERLALKTDRNGMLVEIPATNVTLKTSDIAQYLGLQRVAKHLGHGDVLEYWKSSPYLLNFMEEYNLKRELRTAVDSGPDRELAKHVRSFGDGLLSRDDLEKFRRINPANARLRSLHADTVGREAWRLLWIPPSLPYYEGSGPFSAPELKGFTKRLVFSSWKVVPKAVASILSYEAERHMLQAFRRSIRNTPEARKKRGGLLRFGRAKGRAAGMPVLGILYPCSTLADRFDPLWLSAALAVHGVLPTSEQLIGHCAAEFEKILPDLFANHQGSDGQTDERWYWAAPLLLDKHANADEARIWLDQTDLSTRWGSDLSASDHEPADNWARHVEVAQEFLRLGEKLGKPPEDLAVVLAQMALACPGVVALRSLKRILPGKPDDEQNIRDFAGPLAHAFRHLFNLPEVVYLLRGRNNDVPYWRCVLEYCVAGNLQAVIDEYTHLLVDSLGIGGSICSKMATELCKLIAGALTLRTSTAKADFITANRRRVMMNDDDALRMRTRFAMRFGDQEAEDSSEPTPADSVRSAFNSPFWPFVLATTSVGQEGLDFHHYCHAVVHWNLPSNPVDLEQREGRVHRYKGHAIRKNIAAGFRSAMLTPESDPWTAMFAAARAGRPDHENDLFPFWIAPDGGAKIERHVPALPHSRELRQKANLVRSLVLYRMVYGQNRQEDLVDYLASQLPEGGIDELTRMCRIDLSPAVTASADEITLPSSLE
jgi:hypothetical protein